MCIPLAVAGMAMTAFEVGMLAVSAATTIASNAQQAKAGAAQAKAIESSQNAAAGQRETQRQQVNMQASQKSSEVSRQATIERAKLQTLAGESGVSGGALDRLSSELSFREADALGSVEYNRNNTMLQSDFEARADQAKAQSQINSIDTGPGWLGTGLQIIGMGGAAVGKGKKIPNSTYTGRLGA